MPLKEHDYIGLSEVPSVNNSDNGRNNKDLNLKATELRLGLPGSESPERETGISLEDKNVYPLKVLVSAGAKRGFSDTIDAGSGKWVFSANGGAEVDLAKTGPFLSPRSVNGGGKILGVGGSESNTQASVMASSAVKEVVPPVQKPKPVPEKKPQISAANGRGVPPAAK